MDRRPLNRSGGSVRGKGEGEEKKGKRWKEEDMEGRNEGSKRREKEREERRERRKEAGGGKEGATRLEGRGG